VGRGPSRPDGSGLLGIGVGSAGEWKKAAWDEEITNTGEYHAQADHVKK
jgi:hypothetical protein